MPEHINGLPNCPICKKVAVARYLPFCSKRCADLDLGRWLNESYAIPSEEPATEEEFGSLDQLPHPDRDR